MTGADRYTTYHGILVLDIYQEFNVYGISIALCKALSSFKKYFSIPELVHDSVHSSILLLNISEQFEQN